MTLPERLRLGLGNACVRKDSPDRHCVWFIRESHVLVKVALEGPMDSV